MEKWPIGVFASIDAGLGVRWEVIRQLDVPTIHLHAPAAENRTAEKAQQFRRQLDEMSVAATVVFAGFEGESYADIPTVERTIGLVPEATRAARLEELRSISDFTRHLGCDAVGLHIGVVPHEADDPRMEGIVQVARQLCDHCGGNGQGVHLETGQESAEGLLQFISLVDRDNLFINFDPANMILYGIGQPIPALQAVGSLVRSVHCKDANWSDQPGVTWGQEVPLGEGQVDIRRYLQTLDAIGYRGPLTIEREIPQDPERQLRELSGAVDLLRRLKEELG